MQFSYSLFVFLVLLVLAVTMFTSTEAYSYWRPRRYWRRYGSYDVSREWDWDDWTVSYYNSFFLEKHMVMVIYIFGESILFIWFFPFSNEIPVCIKKQFGCEIVQVIKIKFNLKSFFFYFRFQVWIAWSCCQLK